MKILLSACLIAVVTLGFTLYNRTDLEWEMFRFRNGCELTGQEAKQRALFREEVGGVYHYIPAVVRVREWKCDGGRKFLMSY